MDQVILVREVLKLPLRERAALADSLLASLDDKSSSAIDQAWAQEAEARFQAYKSGQIESIDGPTVICELRGRFVR